MPWLAYPPWFPVIGVALVALMVALIVHRIGRAVVLRLVRFSVLLTALAQHCDRAVQFVFMLVAMQLVWQGAPEALPSVAGVRHVTALLLIAALTWLILCAIKGVAEGVIRLHPVDIANNLEARRVHT
jgi:hypothetical protein